MKIKNQECRRRGKAMPCPSRGVTNLLVLILLLICIHGCVKVTPPQGVTAKVVRVLSGQSLEVTGISEQPNFRSQVRLIGVEAPDLQQQPWGAAAKAYLTTLITNQTVLLEFDAQVTDTFGRHLAYVWKNQVLVNELLVKDGYALVIKRSPNYKYDQRLENAQQTARLMGRVIWNPEQPMRLTPGEFRRQQNRQS